MTPAAAVSVAPRASPPPLRLRLRLVALVVGPPEPPRPNLAAARALMLACLVGLWIAGASAATAAVILAVHPSGKARRLIEALVAASFWDILLAELLAKIALALLVNAALGFPDSVLLQARMLKLSRMLHDTAWLEYVVALVFVVMSLAGCLVVVELSKKKGPPVGTTGTLIIDAVVVAFARTACLDMLPKMALKLWRMKPAAGAMPVVRCIV